MILACKQHIFSRTLNRVVSSSLGGTRCCLKVHSLDTKLVSSQSRIRFSSSQIQPRFSRHYSPTYWERAVPWITTAIVGCTWAALVPSTCMNQTLTTTCEVAIADNDATALSIQLQSVDMVDTKKSLREILQRIFRLFRRLLKLTIALSPIVALYPVHFLLTKVSGLSEAQGGDGTDAHQVALASLVENPNASLNWYYKVCLYCVEWSGAAAIKIMQWAGSRPDMFGQSFCAVFSQLQDDTTPHSWKYTERALREAYGENWQEHIRLDEILGSGCIAQVYKGVIYNDQGQEQQVAVKVMHPNVDDHIDADLDIMRLVTHIVDLIPMDAFRNLKWMNLPGIVEEMSRLLKIQLDLRTEADHLARFNENFKDNDVILFPKLVDGYKPTKEVLIETFCPGEPIMEFIRGNKGDQKALTEMCAGAIRAVCQMIFLDNFIHGDLHPGNVLITNDKKFVLLDVGIVVENNKKDHRLISDVLAAFIRKNGREAGRRMIEDSNARLVDQNEYAINEGQFLDKIEDLTIRASGKDYLMEHLGAYITIICNAAAKHHIMLNPAFVSAALAVKVQEGIALALDPSVQIWRIAIPIILEGERRNGYVADRAKELMGWERMMEWLRGTGGSSTSKESTKL